MVRSTGDVGVVVASRGRSAELAQLVLRLRQQTHRPAVVMLAIPGMEDAPSLSLEAHERLLIAPPGSAVQRNVGIDALGDDVDYIAFFDDDSVPAEDYLESALRIFEGRPEVAGLTGSVILDGAPLHREISLDEADEALAHRRHVSSSRAVTATKSLYGCNVVVRARAASGVRFDENMRGYAWLEDRDYAAQVGRRGLLVRAHNCHLVHRGVTSGGRTQHFRLGQAQMLNPCYLFTRGSLTVREVLAHMLPPLLSNLYGGILSRKGAPWRRERLRGNISALRSLLVDRRPLSRKVREGLE